MKILKVMDNNNYQLSTTPPTLKLYIPHQAVQDSWLQI